MIDRPDAIRLSVVVPTYRRPELLAVCLNALQTQSLSPVEFEIIVVDDGHDPRTRDLVHAMARQRTQPALRYLRPATGRGPAVARNAGWRAARGEIVGFTDDDTVPDAEWLVEGLRAMGTSVAAVRGRVVVPLPARITDHVRMTQGLEAAEFVTANCFVRRDVLARLDGFDERFPLAWREDSDLHFRLLERYGDIPRAAAAVVSHPARPVRWGISLRQQRNACFDALLYRKHRARYLERIGPPFAPPSYYAVVVATVAAVGLLASGRHRPAALAAGLATALVLRFAARRLRGTSAGPHHVLEMLVTSAAIPFLSLFWRWRGALRYRVPFF